MRKQPSTARSAILTALIYLLQLAIVLLVVFHQFDSKDIGITVSLLIAMYGMSTAQAAFEGAISGMHFVTIFRLLLLSKDVEATEEDAELRELAQKDTPFTFAH